jgi:hypothetical protein
MSDFPPECDLGTCIDKHSHADGLASSHVPSIPQTGRGEFDSTTQLFSSSFNEPMPVTEHSGVVSGVSSAESMPADRLSDGKESYLQLNRGRRGLDYDLEMV